MRKPFGLIVFAFFVPFHVHAENLNCRAERAGTSDVVELVATKKIVIGGLELPYRNRITKSGKAFEIYSGKNAHGSFFQFEVSKNSATGATEVIIKNWDIPGNLDSLAHIETLICK